MRNAIIRFRNGPNAIPYFAAVGNEIIYGSITRSAVISLS